MKLKPIYIFLFILFLGLVIRFILVGNTGFVADVSFWKSWSLAAIDHGIVWTTHNTNINYPPGFVYVLWVMGKIYSFFADPHDFNNFWRENNFLFLFSSKVIAILADIAIAGLIYWFFSQKEQLKKLGVDMNREKTGNSHTFLKYMPLVLAGVFYLNPIVILDSALWGQVESFGIMFTVISIILLFYKKPVLATCFFTVGALMKLQNIIYIPIYFIFILRYFDFRTLAKSMGAAVATFFLVNLPFVLANDMKQVLYLMTVNSDYFPWLSLNAHNIWWIVAGAKGMQVGDRITVLGLLNAKYVGLVIFSSVYFLCTLLVFLKPTPKSFLISLTVAIFGFFLFTTQSHERYSYPVIVFLLLVYPLIMYGSRFSAYNGHGKANGKKLSEETIQTDSKTRVASGTLHLLSPRLVYFWVLYSFFTVSIFFNMHTGLILNYPNNGFMLLTKMTSPVLTIGNSYLQTILFFLLLPYIFMQISPFSLAFPVIIFILGILKPHAGYYSKGQVPLTVFRTIITQQDFGTPQVDMSVNSSGGWKTWNRLSNNYFYYRKGLGSHANSFLVFDINRMFTRFTTDFGVDTEAGTPATVTFKIYGDDRELFSSEKMGRFDFPKHADINIAGVKKLGLVITDAGDGINSDHADWLNPVLHR